MLALGAWQTGTPLPEGWAGKLRAVDCSSDLICAGFSAGLADSISAAAPATIGVAKLVPTE